MKAPGIYVIRHIASGREYVGSARVPKYRWGLHRGHLHRGTHHSPILQRAWDKYGPEAFEFRVLEIVASPADLISAEQRHIDERKPHFNVLAIAGSSLGYKHTPEAKRKMSLARKGKPLSSEKRAEKAEQWRRLRADPSFVERWTTANLAALTGRQVSEATREKLRMAKLGVPKPPGFGDKMAAINRARGPVSDVTRQRMSAARLGKRPTEEHRMNLSRAQKGHPVSEETRRKLSQSKRAADLRKKLEQAMK